MSTPPEIIESLRNNPDPNAKVLFHLAKQGSDLTKPHKSDFTFFFENETAAKAAEWKLSEPGFDVTIFPPDTEHERYEVMAVKTFVPELEELNKLTQEFEELAEELGGDFDGWGAEVVD
jgi:regulator of ribonuclease activity B